MDRATSPLRYGIPVGSGEFYVYTDWAYRSEVNFFLYESTEFTGKSLLEGGLRVGYIWDDGKYDAARLRPQHHRRGGRRRGIDFNNLTGFLNEPRICGRAVQGEVLRIRTSPWRPA